MAYKIRNLTSTTMVIDGKKEIFLMGKETAIVDDVTISLPNVKEKEQAGYFSIEKIKDTKKIVVEDLKTEKVKKGGNL